jgi:hypothetical protein
VLSSGFTLAVSIGGILDLGILRTPGEIAAVVPDPFPFVSLWVLSGLFILLSTVVAAELAGLTPRSGGTYARDVADPPKPAVHEHTPNSSGIGGRWPGLQARKGHGSRQSLKSIPPLTPQSWWR